ncbi:hypothetical protein CAP36_10440 [Chitinophagaceae bacterium IBVUCB2]|nr:hypothetical protein CAP36_10440 [Chitinophagaceae bacterium IBVUCB2]
MPEGNVFIKTIKPVIVLRSHTNHILTKLIALSIAIVIGITSVSAQAPSANFTGTPIAGCSPLIVTFRDQSTGNPTSWNWNFGNGNTSTLQHPTATYFTPGTYTVTLTATNATGSNTLVRTSYITVWEPPTVNFSASSVAGCFPLKVQFTDLSTAGVGNNNVTWAWDFGNGVTSSLQNPEATYETAGNFTVTLRVTNDKGCVKVISRPNYIRVTTGVTADFTNSQATVCRAPANISFTNATTGPPTLSYEWDFGDGSPISTATNPIHTYTANGTFVVTLIARSTAGCVDTFRSAPIIIGNFTTAFTGPTSICVNESATFTNTSLPVPVSSSWDFGDGGTATGLTATHTYSVPGTYTVKVYSNFTSCLDSSTNTITVNPRPVADFSAPITSKCEPPLTVNFQDLTTGGATGWQWDFGDGGTSTLQNPSHTYTAYGNFDVTLIVTNGFGCTDTIVKPAYINIQRAIINITGLPARGCIPFTINPIPVITALDVVTSYEWDFGDGSPLDFNQFPTHTYPLQGTYNVRLVITTSGGCRDTLIINSAVRTGSKPTADFTASPLVVCATRAVQFTDLSTPSTVDEWLWDFGDGGSSTLQNPTYNYQDTGFFDVQLIATNNGCPDTLIKLNYIQVLPPIARFAITPDCNNRLRFIFTDQSIVNPALSPLTWTWDFGDGSPLDNTQSPTHIFPALGVYSVTLTVTNGTCTHSVTQTVNSVDENPDFIADQTSVCKISQINFQATGINTANIVSYTWDFGDGSPLVTVPSPVISHTYTTAGTYTVTLTTLDINGCQDSRTKTNYIRINGPTANFDATNTAGCTGFTTTFNDLSVTDGINAITNWQWNFGDGFIQNFAAPPFQHTYNTTGVYSVKLIITDAAGCRDSITLTNLINATDPIPNFITADTLSCPGGIVTFTNTSSPAGFTSQWDFGDGGTSNLTSPTHSYAATGIYDVKLRIDDAFGCADSITKVAYIRVAEPDASFTVSDSISSCVPLEVQFTNTSTFYTSVVWDFGTGEGNSTLNNPVHFYSTPGTYTVKLLITSPGGCLDSAFHTIVLDDTAGSRIDYLPIGGCKPLDVSLNILTAATISSYYWDFGDGYTETTTTPTTNHIYSSFGNFLPKIIMTDPSGCIIPLQGLDTVFVIGATANFGVDDSLFCDFGTANFSDSTIFNDPITSFNWDFGDGGTSTLQNPTYTYAAPGLYSVQLTILTQGGCRDTLTKPNYIAVVQRPLIDIAGDTVVCVNSSLLHSGIFLQPDTSVVTWQWTFPNGNTSNLEDPVAQRYLQAGTFTITAIATNSSGCRDTTTQNILVNPLPTVTMPPTLTIQAGFPAIIPAVYTPNVITWSWTPVTGLSCTNCANPEAGPSFNTNYQVIFSDVNGCRNYGNIVVQVLCQQSNLFIPNTFSPNADGSNDVFYPRGIGLARTKFLRIFNRWGEVVFEKQNFPVNDASYGWDGTFKGKKAQPDVYVYQAEVFCENGDIIKLNGNIALIL